MEVSGRTYIKVDIVSFQAIDLKTTQRVYFRLMIIKWFNEIRTFIISNVLNVGQTYSHSKIF